MGLKIAFYSMGDRSWFAGGVYLKNLIYAIHYTYGTDIKACILTKDTSCYQLKELREQSDEILLLPDFSTSPRWTLSWFIDTFMLRVFPYKISNEMKKAKETMRNEYFLKQHGVDVLFGSAIQDRYRKIPTLSWIWDFQHNYLPEMFNPGDSVYINKLFLKTAKVSSRLIVMSETVKKDFEKFLPEYLDKVKVIPPAIYIPESIYKTNSNFIVDFYNLPEKFIYLPNQFWRHKNHEIVFRALMKLKEKGVIIYLVCSGSSYDNRHPGYFESLFKEISKGGVRNQVIYLGIIPYEHVLLLMRKSICVLNPSLFEGFGMTVDEAWWLGKQVLLSDIPAHREQNPPKAIFFDPKNIEELADKLNKVWQELQSGPDFELEAQSRKALSVRIKETAQSFISVVREVMKK